MTEKLIANASPEKRLFISLLTRDISLVDAVLDLIDNSINAAMEPFADQLKTSKDFQEFVINPPEVALTVIDVMISENGIQIKDNATGITADAAQKSIFKFGRPAEKEDSHKDDRLSVYGIGLKRAIFKCGKNISVISDHRNGGFSLQLDVDSWAREASLPWKFEIERRAPEDNEKKTGTDIRIRDLHSDVVSRINDGSFLGELEERISRTYAFFLDRIAEIRVQSRPVAPGIFDIGENYASESFETGGVSCSVLAGITKYADARRKYIHNNAGWFVFCNGRTVIFADKSPLTGWGIKGQLPIFQPKHRPFLGLVFFSSEDPELLPWTTTKSAINQENAAWQAARRTMNLVGRQITGYLDRRYSSSGTEVSADQLADIAGSSVPAARAVTTERKAFRITAMKKDSKIRIQYSVREKDVQRIANHLGKKNMSGADVGRYTFSFFLENEVGDD